MATEGEEVEEGGRCVCVGGGGPALTHGGLE